MKKLYRSQDQILGGVCAGIAEYFNIDTTLVRVIVSIIFLGILPYTFIIYIIMWVITPLKKF